MWRAFKPSEYPKPEDLENRLDIVQHPFLGRAYVNSLEDYRNWIRSSPNDRLQTHFEMVKHRELHGYYTKSPLVEFLTVLDEYEEKEIWNVVPEYDKDGYPMTAYPPGQKPVDPTDFEAIYKADVSPEEIEKAEENAAIRAAREIYDLSEELEDKYTEDMENYKGELANRRNAFLSGEEIVPNMKPLKMPLDPRAPILPDSPYSDFDTIAFEEIFKPKIPGDLSASEAARQPIDPARRHISPDISSMNIWTEIPAAWSEVTALSNSYLRALISHHTACLIALKENISLPPSPLPDPRLDEATIKQTRLKFADMLRDIKKMLSPVESLDRDALIVATIKQSQKDGLLPEDPALLPSNFKMILDQAEYASFVAKRADKILPQSEVETEAKEAIPTSSSESAANNQANANSQSTQSSENPNPTAETIKTESVTDDATKNTKPLEPWQKVIEELSNHHMRQLKHSVRGDHLAATTHELFLATTASLSNAIDRELDRARQEIQNPSAEATELEQYRLEVIRSSHAEFIKKNPLPEPPIIDPPNVKAALEYCNEVERIKNLHEQHLHKMLLENPSAKLEKASSRAKLFQGALNMYVADYQGKLARMLKKFVDGNLTRTDLEQLALYKTSKLPKESADIHFKRILTALEEQFMPQVPIEEKIERYGELQVRSGTYRILEKSQRIRIATEILESFEGYWKHRDMQYLPKKEEKTNVELLKERDERILEQRESHCESLMNTSPEELRRAQAAWRQEIIQTQQAFNIYIGYRDMKIIETNDELKYMGKAPVWTRAQHLPLPKWTWFPMRIAAAITHWGIRKPQTFLMKKLTPIWDFITLQTPWWRQKLVKWSNMDLLMGPKPVGPDAKTRGLVHRYYLDHLYRLTVLFTPTAMTIPERVEASKPRVPTWFEWRLNTFRLRMIRRLDRLASGTNFLLVPAAFMIGFLTWTHLDQRKTSGHDVLRMAPAGLEMSLTERRKSIQRFRSKFPWWLYPDGPTGFWTGRKDEPDVQNAPYIHRPNSSNARTFKLIE